MSLLALKMENILMIGVNSREQPKTAGGEWYNWHHSFAVTVSDFYTVRSYSMSQMLNDKEMIAKRRGGHRFEKRKRIRWSLPIFNTFYAGSAVRGIMNLPPCCNRNSRTKWENSVNSPHFLLLLLSFPTCIHSWLQILCQWVIPVLSWWTDWMFPGCVWTSN